ncbi:hypothetical protein [Hyphomonas sp.]|uniref:hypothetical protein n=1 Tax=Hyphomonas sp. TaxID=87 RepID=UPI003561B6EB
MTGFKEKSRSVNCRRESTKGQSRPLDWRGSNDSPDQKQLLESLELGSCEARRADTESTWEALAGASGIPALKSILDRFQALRANAYEWSER